MDMKKMYEQKIRDFEFELEVIEWWKRSEMKHICEQIYYYNMMLKEL